MFNLKAGNGEVVLTSQLYASKAGALTGIESVRKNAEVAERFEERTATDGSPYFVLKAGNGEVIGKSQMYSAVSSMRGGVASVRENGPSAALVDLTV